MFSRKTVVSSLAFVLLAVAPLAGCSEKNAEPAQNNTPVASEPETTGLPMKDGKYDPPVTLTANHMLGAKFKDGETLDNNVMTKWLKEKTGIELKYPFTAPNPEQMAQKIKLAISSNEELPDVIYAEGNVFPQLIDSGKFMDVTELFDEYASPLVKEAYAQAGADAWNPFVREGRKMAIPVLGGAYGAEEVLWVREDWKKKLNLPDPVTLDDFEKMLEAFTNGDPDGNGKKDTFGMSLGIKDSISFWGADPGFVFGAFGTMPSQWNKTADDQLEYGSINPASKLALGKLADWFKKGYLNQDLGAINVEKAPDNITKGKAGVITGTTWFVSSNGWPIPLQELQKVHPDAEMKPYPLPSGPDGKQHRRGWPMTGGAYLINKNMKNPEIFFTYLNALYAAEKSSNEKGGEWEFGLAEGYDWIMADGKPSVDDKNFPDGKKYNVRDYFIAGWGFPMEGIERYVRLANGNPPETFKDQAVLEGSPWAIPAGKILDDQKAGRLEEMFTGPPTETMKTKREYLTKIELQTYAKIIYGEQSVDSFDKFVETWKAGGGEQMTKEVNAWYASVKK